MAVATGMPSAWAMCSRGCSIRPGLTMSSWLGVALRSVVAGHVAACKLGAVSQLKGLPGLIVALPARPPRNNSLFDNRNCSAMSGRLGLSLGSSLLLIGIFRNSTASSPMSFTTSGPRLCARRLAHAVAAPSRFSVAAAAAAAAIADALTRPSASPSLAPTIAATAAAASALEASASARSARASAAMALSAAPLTGSTTGGAAWLKRSNARSPSRPPTGWRMALTRTLPILPPKLPRPLRRLG
mmetsp:Transcript_9692/g.15566  ORF Transcript_9692/g.15566 Transcript_9692/m.15566 type:complete len:243 (-) Transcript_9692:278-1006(-)